MEGTVRQIRKKASASSAIWGETGKIPPQAVDFEVAVLGALLLEKDAILVVFSILRADDFYKTEHQVIYEAICALSSKVQPIDMLTVTNRLRQDGKLEIAGGAGCISELTNQVAGAGNIEFHARIIKQKSILRRIIKISGEVQYTAYDEVDCFELLASTQSKLLEISADAIQVSEQPAREVIHDLYKKITEVKKDSNGMKGIPSGIKAVDKITGGWRNGSLIILAARPSIGKTSAALTFVHKACVIDKIPTLFFSMEMTAAQLMINLWSIDCQIENGVIESGEMSEDDWKRVHTSIGKIEAAPLYIDAAKNNIKEIRIKALRRKAQGGLGLIVVDYLQIIRSHDRALLKIDLMGIVCEELKDLGKELDIPVILLSQLNREVEKRGGRKIPQLSDLKESGSIEENGDVILFIYRPEKAGIMESDNGIPTKGQAAFIVAKNKWGGTDDAWCQFLEKTVTFLDADYTPFHEITSYQSPHSFNNRMIGERENINDPF